MIKWAFLSIITIGTGFGLYLFIHLGAFRDVFVEAQVYPDLHVVWQEHRGPYHEINGPLMKMETALREDGIACKKTFGHFLDNPSTVDEDRLRSRIGCVISKQNSQDLENSDSQFSLKTYPSQKVIYARFKGSPAIGPMKVYPKVRDYADNKRVALKPDVMELYTVQRDGQVTTEYLFVLDSQ